MKEPRLNEGLFGGQELEVVGEVVSAIVLDSSIVILTGKERDHKFRIENDAQLRSPGLDVDIVVRFYPFAEEGFVSQGISSLVRLVGKRVTHAYPWSRDNYNSVSMMGPN